MEYSSNIRNHVYKEDIIVSTILIAIPLVLSLFFNVFYKLLGHYNKINEIKFFAYLLSIIFDLSFILSGGLKSSFEIMKERVYDLFSTIFIIKLKDSFRSWFRSLKDGGPFFWIYLFIMIGHLCLLIKNFILSGGLKLIS